ncbi:hypothetical protein ACQKTA_13315 (plasmid) [Enterococcus sp. 22-H-5-01]|uniref:hypothetical protein n=1 Tax=Enterococcus sp. 22-H-5-01 TaxID=3418555 RepID=UPI003D0098CF
MKKRDNGFTEFVILGGAKTKKERARLLRSMSYRYGYYPQDIILASHPRSIKSQK